MGYLLDTAAIFAHYRQEAGWDEVQALFENAEDVVRQKELAFVLPK